MVKNDLDLPLVSFIINCYNGELFLNNCLNSIVSQTYKNWELIFWDNASTDRSADIFNSINDTRFKYFRSSQNVSLGQARAWAVDQCLGEYIAFLDVDDEWIPEKTEIQIKRMISDNSVLSYSGIFEIFENSNKSRKKIAKHPSIDNFRYNLLQFEIQMPTIMIKRKALLDKNLSFDPFVSASEEYCLCMQLIYNEKVSVIDYPMAKYRIRENSLTNKNIHNWAKERIYTLEKIISNNPEITELYELELREAFSRASYYKARHLFYEKKRLLAIQELSKIKFNSLKYFFLYLISLFPSYFWEKIHFLKNKR